ncbi:uncharacterized protein EMH_0004870 [Eimeria mitis]|uniref:Exoribonuclease phosphorolytic domain-containing protein n=1 Tax=Eimeria mitis TaxID=44415 RepID=U6JWT7_9EIME|nr:uncharacterized protein EMH_0004870 [Eimeria mitis]CDJ29859.1 hypothetical protein EMH_0004870 [Eimeria mitis]
MELDEGPLRAPGLGPPGAPPRASASPPTGFYSNFFSSFQGPISRAETNFIRDGAACGADAILPGGGGTQELYSVSVGCGAAEQELAEVTGGDGGSLSSLLQAMLEQLLLPHLRPLTDANGRPEWRISIDVIVLKAGGCLLDAVSMAIWGALKSLKLPAVFIEEAEEKDQGLAQTEYKVSCDERSACCLG